LIFRRRSVVSPAARRPKNEKKKKNCRIMLLVGCSLSRDETFLEGIFVDRMKMDDRIVIEFIF
jgi:hypothetical protein